jgi:hypothetical protein
MATVGLRRHVKERMRLRIRARLEELGMSGRELALLARPDDHGVALDSWISGILSGAQALSWKHFDAVCDALRISPSEMVREDGSDLRELRPSEMAMLRYFQQWPHAIQDRWLKMLEYFSASAVDEESRRLLHDLQEMSAVERRVLRTYLASIQTRKPPQN